MKARPAFAALAAALIAALAAAPAMAQLGLPPVGQAVGGTLDRTLGTLEQTLDPVTGVAQDAAASAASLARARIERIDRLVRRNRDAIARDANGDPAVKGVLLVVNPAPEALAAARAAGFAVVGEDRLGELGIGVARLSVPAGMDLARAQALLEKTLPGAEISADTLSFEAGGMGDGRGRRANPVLHPAIATPVGMIDGAVGAGAGVRIAATRGFASGAPVASNHGSAVASLLALASVQTIYVADVYGTDRAGGNALAIARGLDWLLGRGAKVVSISLVGPPNPLLARAVSAAQARGAVIVAAVGNDGPAAPPAYPASYPGVLAITAVDGRDRALIEAGKALHLDYAAPGADMLAADAKGRWRAVRGTSYATPLAAARAAAALDAHAQVRAALDREAYRLDPASAYGRGLVCGSCRRTR